MRNQSRQQLRFQAVVAERAHFFKHNLTETEAILWRHISRKQLGVSFKRQVPIGNKYIADFVAPSIKLVVEVDGGIHSARRSRDARRDRTLGRLGYRVVRVPAELVRCNIAQAVAQIVTALRVFVCDQSGWRPLAVTQPSASESRRGCWTCYAWREGGGPARLGSGFVHYALAV